MGRMRVFELAKELKLTSKELKGELKDMRIEVKSHMSFLEDETVAYIKRHWGEDDIDDDTIVPGMKPVEEKPKASKEKKITTESKSEPKKEKENLKITEQVPTYDKKPPLSTIAKPEVQEEKIETKEEHLDTKPEEKPKPSEEKESVVVEEEVDNLPVEEKEEKRDFPVLKLSESVTVGEVAEKLKVRLPEVIKKLMNLGVLATVNQRLDKDTIEILLSEYGYQVEFQALYGDNILAQEELEEEEKPEDLTFRPPVVTIMGHVNHGKTSLLDAIRETNVIEGEAGGITQHIGAYQVNLKKGQVTFLDTPGHEAFTNLRARGAQVTDVVVLIVAADDGVQPQTIEAIDHAKAAEVPIMVAINKIDKPGANVEKIKQELTQYGLVSEEWGGKNIFVEISAKKREGIENLLEMLLLEAEMLELKANKKVRAKGIVVEAKLDRGRGATATVLIQKGTLRIGDAFVSGVQYGKIRALNNDRGFPIKFAEPGTPVEILGISGVPLAGDTFQVLANEKLTRQIAMKRQMIKREQDLNSVNKITLDNLNTQIAEGNIKELKIIIKADVQGSAEVIKNSLEGLSSEKVKLNCIHTAVGNITERDVMLALASNAIILGFNTKPESGAKMVAKTEQVDVRIYKIVYEMIEDVKAAMEGLLEPHYHEVFTGKAEVKTAFKLSNGLFIAGSQVTNGKIVRHSQAKILRESEEIYKGKIASLRRFKDDVKEVSNGMECGILIEGFKDFEPGDIIEVFELEAVAQKL